jgi:phosphoserine phosphatase RsbU/P
VAEFIADLSTVILASAFCTIALVLFTFWAIAGNKRSRGLVLAGVFATLYGLRMLTNTSVAGLLVRSDVLPYINATLEYLVPIPAAILFAYYFGARLRALNNAIAAAFAGVAAIAIPYEIATRSPFAAKPVIDALVIAFMVGFLCNLIVQWRSPELRPLRLGSLVFALFVMNEHFAVVRLPWGLSTEPVGFLIFIGTIVTLLVRRAVTDQTRLVAIESELTTARTIQESIIPDRSPAIPRLQIAAMYRPASQVGGDFYDFIPLDSDRLGIFIADVSGHGVPAALVASMLKIGVAAQDDLVNPSAVLGHLNGFFCGRLKRQFFTAAYVVIDPVEGTLRVASGGHPPVMVIRDSRAEELEARGFVVGRMRGATFETEQVAFAEGAVAVLYTDGIVEATRNGEVWGYERLRECIEISRNATADEITRRIVQSVDQWCDGEAEDDLTLVVVKNVGRET